MKLQSTMARLKIFGKGPSKSQSAMEYLMTYGWAILIIAIVMVALFALGVFNPLTFAPKAQPGSCSVNRNSYGGTSLSGVCNGQIPEFVAQFNGQSSYVNMGNPTSITQPGSSFAIFAWVKTTSSQGRKPIVTFGSPSSCNTAEWFFISLSSQIESDLSCTVGPASAVTVTNGNWHFVGVVNTANTFQIYIDGVASGSPLVMSPNIQPGSFEIGKDFSSNLFVGSIANVQIYNTALSSNSIQALYQEGIGGAPIDLQNLAGWWPLNGNANDYSVNGNNGQASNVIYTSGWYSGYTQP